MEDFNEDDVWDIPIGSGFVSKDDPYKHLIQFLAYLVDNHEPEIVTEEWLLKVGSEYLEKYGE